jgi:ribosomal small subunit protein bTHX
MVGGSGLFTLQSFLQEGDCMGRGDSRTRRGKIFKGSYGNTRKQRTANPHKPTKGTAAGAVKKPTTAKKSK